MQFGKGTLQIRYCKNDSNVPKDSDFDLICLKLVSCYAKNVLTDSYAILPLGHACFASLKA